MKTSLASKTYTDGVVFGSPAQLRLNSGLPIRFLLWMNNDGREKNTDARRGGRRIDDRRRRINASPVTITVAIRPIHGSPMHIGVAIIPASASVLVVPTASVIVTAVVIISPIVIFGEGRRRVHTADHQG
jgi:hypothetical protein